LDLAAAANTAAWKVTTWNLKRTANYGSDHIDEVARGVAAVKVSSDGRQVALRVPDFAATWCYALEWKTTAADGSPVQGVLHGTMH
ncbi:MAG: hypothetical protein DWI04_08300, partial [Planctomycetota bacterium]